MGNTTTSPTIVASPTNVKAKNLMIHPPTLNVNNKVLHSYNVEDEFEDCSYDCGRKGVSELNGLCTECYSFASSPYSETKQNKDTNFLGLNLREISKKDSFPFTKESKDEELEEDMNEDSSDSYAENEDNTFAQECVNHFVDCSEKDDLIFQVVEKDCIYQLMNTKVSEVSSLVALPFDKSALLLQYFKWNEENLKYRFFESPDSHLQKAGIMREPIPVSSSCQIVECKICFDEISLSDTFALDCGHSFYCKSCWFNCLQKISQSSAGEILNASCLHKNCPVRLTSDNWEQLSSPEIFQIYKYFRLKDFVETNSKTTFCPNPNCGNAVSFLGSSSRPMRRASCFCGTDFCFACSQTDHFPLPCSLFKQWQDKINSKEIAEFLGKEVDWRASLDLVRSISKLCPFCGIAIEKTSGCNHMICRAEIGGCGKHFCWVCLTDWSTHGDLTGGFYHCNKQKQISAKEIQNALFDSIQNTNSLNLSTLKEFAQKFKFLDINEHNYKIYRRETAENFKFHFSVPTELSQLSLQGMDLLIQSTNFLKFSNSLVYFLSSNKKQETVAQLLIFQLDQLENSVIKLKELLYSSIEIIAEKKLHLIKLIEITSQCLANLSENFEF